MVNLNFKSINNWTYAEKRAGIPQAEKDQNEIIKFLKKHIQNFCDGTKQGTRDVAMIYTWGGGITPTFGGGGLRKGAAGEHFGNF